MQHGLRGGESGSLINFQLLLLLNISREQQQSQLGAEKLALP